MKPNDEPKADQKINNPEEPGVVVESRSCLSQALDERLHSIGRLLVL